MNVKDQIWVYILFSIVIHYFQYCDPLFSNFNFPPDLKTNESYIYTIQSLGNLYHQDDSSCSIKKKSFMQG
jgi:hypothetical protein